jgi:AraC-like DNA-binding protein
MPEMKEIERILKLSGQGLLISGETNRRVACLMNQMLKASPSGRVILLLTILDEISVSAEFSLLAKKSFNYSTNYKDDDKLSKVFEYTFQRFNKKILIKDVAALISLSTQSFCRYFKVKTRKTYFQFLIEIRIGYACKLLMDNELTVSEICYRCGYRTTSHFNHQFKEHMQVTPGQYRDERLKKVLSLHEQCRNI